MSLNPTFGSHAAVQMRVRPALRLGGGRRVEREGRAAVEDREGGTGLVGLAGLTLQGELFTSLSSSHIYHRYWRFYILCTF